MQAVQRKYKTKDVDMLITAGTILESAIRNKEYLQSKRSTWADPFFNDLKIRIDNVTEEYLGTDNAKALRHSTLVIKSIQKTAMADLAEIKVQVDEDFKDEEEKKEEILKQLGFTAYLKAARERDQEALISLLFQFKKNITPALKNEIVTKGTNNALIERVIVYADQLRDADVNQESNKGVRKVITSEAITEFNKVYKEVISICKIAAKFYLHQPAIKQQFSYSNVSKALNAQKAAPPIIVDAQ